MGKKIKLGVLVLVMLALLVGGYYVVRLVWLRPLAFSQFQQRVVLEQLLEDPEAVSRWRPAWLSEWDQLQYRLSPATAAQAKARHALAVNQLQILEGYDPEELSLPDRHTWEQLHWQLTLQAKADSFAVYQAPLRAYGGAQAAWGFFLNEVHRMESETDCEAYLIRLMRVPEKLEQVLAYHQAERDLPGSPTRWELTRIADALDVLAATPPQESPLYFNFARHAVTADPTELNETEAVKCLENLVSHLENKVYPACRELSAALRREQEMAPMRVGLNTPAGLAYHRYGLRRFAGWTGSPDSLRALAEAELSRVEAEMSRSLQAAGWEAGPVPLALRALYQDSSHYVAPADEGWAELRESFEAEAKRARVLIGGLFETVVGPNLRVQAWPHLPLDPQAPWRLLPGSLDGTRLPQLYLHPAAQMHPRWQLKAQVYAATFPGSFFFQAFQQQRDPWPAVRQLSSDPAFLAGWPLFANYLMDHDLQLFSNDPLARLGYLHQRQIAAELVWVDAFLHQENGLPDSAAIQLHRRTGLPLAQASSWVDFCLAQPGQGSGAFAGFVALRSLREQTATRLGAVYFPAAFHQTLLSYGAAPLPLLQAWLKTWDGNPPEAYSGRPEG